MHENGAKVAGKTIMTFDVRRRAYRSWSFMSNGLTSDGAGQYDPRTRTFTWTSRDPHDGSQSVSTSTLESPDKEVWSVVTTSRDGSPVSMTRGQTVRKR